MSFMLSCLLKRTVRKMIPPKNNSSLPLIIEGLSRQYHEYSTALIKELCHHACALSYMGCLHIPLHAQSFKME